ncbi:MAG: class II aldolase/adducin family protein [Haliscomenobacter sp.]
MNTEGYIKFQAHWTPCAAFDAGLLEELNAWRQRCYARGWIGAFPDGIGFGNISQRVDSGGRFFISGSATGNIPVLDAAQYALVEEVQAASNALWCSGPVIASSESMSHAAVYAACAQVQGVIHIHHRGMWEYLLAQGQATHPEATYGSPEMVEAILNWLAGQAYAPTGVFAMAGHEDGIFAYGRNLEEAFRQLEGLE